MILRPEKLAGSNFENLEMDVEDSWGNQGLFDEWSNNIVALSTPLKPKNEGR